MHNLNYELKNLCQGHREGSYATCYDRDRILTLVANQLHAQGFRHLQANNLKPKHVEALVKRWQAEGLSEGAMKNRLCVIRWWAAKIRKPNVVARSNDAYGIAGRSYVVTVSKAWGLTTEALNRVTDPYSALSLRLQAVFGLRRVESIKIRPDWADRGDKLVLKNTWCMGGREREIPIRTDLQRAVLDDAKRLAGTGSQIPEDMSYVDQLQRFKGQCAKANIRHVHGLRYAYAEQRYKELTGRHCPAAGGKPSAKLDAEEQILDTGARLTISNELGHRQVKETVAYLGR